MRHPPRCPRPIVRLTIVSLVAVAASGWVGETANADPDPVFPSAVQVARANAAVGGKAAQAAVLDAELSAARESVAQLEDAAAAAGMASNSARILLEQRAKLSAAARVEVAAARGRSDEANLALSRYAAEVYQQGSGSLPAFVDLFTADGPQDVLDRAEGLQTVGNERARVMGEAEAAKLLAQSAERVAEEAQGRQDAAALAALAAEKRARSESGQAASEAARLAVTQQDVVQQLAVLRGTSVELENQRQAGLVAAEQTMREDAARRAGVAAAALATQQAAAATAAQQSAAASAERSARSAREAAAAATARRVADEAARQAGLQAVQVPPTATTAPPLPPGLSQPPPAPASEPPPAPAAQSVPAPASQSPPAPASQSQPAPASQSPPAPASQTVPPPVTATPTRPPSSPPTPSPTSPAAPAPPPPAGAGLNLANAPMWDRIAECESGGDWHINTGNGYYGGLQFDNRTWLGAGGRDFGARADLASREQQITVANRVYAKRGLQPWSCGYAGR